MLARATAHAHKQRKHAVQLLRRWPVQPQRHHVHGVPDEYVPVLHRVVPLHGLPLRIHHYVFWCHLYERLHDVWPNHQPLRTSRWNRVSPGPGWPLQIAHKRRIGMPGCLPSRHVHRRPDLLPQRRRRRWRQPDWRMLRLCCRLVRRLQGFNGPMLCKSRHMPYGHQSVWFHDWRRGYIAYNVLQRTVHRVLFWHLG